MNMQKIFKQVQEMQSRISEAQAKSAETEYEGKAGGGMVRVTINGKGEARKVQIDPKLLAAEEKEVLEDLIVAAFNDAKAKADADMSSSMDSIASMLPPGFKLPV